MPFNEPLERLKQAGEVDMLPLDVVIYALDIPGIDFHKAELRLLSSTIFIVFTRRHWMRLRRLTKCHVRMPSECIVFYREKKSLSGK